MIFTMLYDIIWISFVYKTWTTSEYLDPVSNDMHSIRTFGIVFSIVILISKVLFSEKI